MDKKNQKEVVVSLDRGINEAVAEYIAAKQAYEAAKQTMDTFKPMIEAHLHASGGKAKFGEYNFTLAECAGQERFNLKAAKERIDGRILRPFISVGESYTRLTVTRDR